MRNVFAMHSNVERFTALADSLQDRNRGVDGIGLSYGPPGVGKTGSAIRYCDTRDAVYYRLKAIDRAKSLLKGIVKEFGQVPAQTIDDLYAQAHGLLNEFPRLVIIDEIDYLIDSTKAINTIRDLADETASPFLLIGMMHAERKLMKLEHLYDRLSAHIIHLKPLTFPDVKRFVQQVCEVQLEDSVIDQIGRVSGGKLRKIFIEIYKAEKIARINDVQTVTMKLLKKVA